MAEKRAKSQATAVMEPERQGPSDEERLNALIAQVQEAQKRYSQFTQEQVDHIFHTAAMAANTHRIRLAKLAADETCMGVAEDKVIKNHFASEFVYNKFKDVPPAA